MGRRKGLTGTGRGVWTTGKRDDSRKPRCTWDEAAEGEVINYVFASFDIILQ